MSKRVLALVTALMLAACGGTSHRVDLPVPSPPTEALAKWKDFPAKANPRPLIVFGRSFEHFGPSGFSSEPDRKIDWFCNKFTFRSGVALPASAPSRATAGGSSYPGISAVQAWSELTAARAPSTAQSPNCAKSQPFVIVAVRWGTAGFPTDRGNTTMSAWLFVVGEIEAYLAYAGLDPSSFWGGAVTTNEGRGARVSADGLTLKIPVSNAEPGPCGSDYTAATAESPTAVAVAVKQIPHASPGQNVVCRLSLTISYISATLKHPLGGRVLLDEKGNVGAVCPESGC